MDAGDLEGSSTDLQEVSNREVSAGKLVNAPGARFVSIVGGDEGGDAIDSFGLRQGCLESGIFSVALRP